MDVSADGDVNWTSKVNLVINLRKSESTASNRIFVMIRCVYTYLYVVPFQSVSYCHGKMFNDDGDGEGSNWLMDMKTCVRQV